MLQFFVGGPAPGQGVRTEKGPGDCIMTTPLNLRTGLFLPGLFAIVVAVVLDPLFASVPPVSVPEPNTLALLGLGGVAITIAALIRRLRK